MIRKIINFILELLGLKKSEAKHEKVNTNWYSKKRIMSSTEMNFYKMLKQIAADQFVVLPQINLATVIEKNKSYPRQYQNELYRNIDYGIFNKDTFELLLLIELNDESHNEPHRRQRDENVKEICSKCGYNLIKFWVNKPNEYNYVRNRVLYYLGALDFNIDSTKDLQDIVSVAGVSTDSSTSDKLN